MLNATTIDHTDERRAQTVQRELLAVVQSYRDAQRVVDQLADRGFGVGALQIVGSGLRSVEQVTGRLTTGRAALYGAAGGAWWGAFVGVLLGLFTPAWLAPLLVSVLIGSAFGALTGGVTHAAMRGQRDFRSVHSVSASSYEVLVDADHAAEARGLLAD